MMTTPPTAAWDTSMRSLWHQRAADVTYVDGRYSRSSFVIRSHLETMTAQVRSHAIQRVTSPSGLDRRYACVLSATVATSCVSVSRLVCGTYRSRNFHTEYARDCCRGNRAN